MGLGSVFNLCPCSGGVAVLYLLQVICASLNARRMGPDADHQYKFKCSWVREQM